MCNRKSDRQSPHKPSFFTPFNGERSTPTHFRKGSTKIFFYLITLKKLSVHRL